MSRVNPFVAPRPKKVLIAFMTAHHPSRKPHIAAQRERMKGSPLPYVFVFGTPESNQQPARAPLADELFFPVDDTKPFLVHKCQALFRWAMDQGYDYVFRACDDSVVYPQRIIDNAPLLCQHDYAGTFCGFGELKGQECGHFALKYLDYMHGGVGIWLSRRAMEMLVNDKWQGPFSSPYSNYIELTPGNEPFKGAWSIYWDDLWIGEVLKGNLNYNDPKRNEIYDNYRVHVLDAPDLFASNLPFNPDKVISTHSLEQMGKTDLHPKAYSTRTGELKLVSVDWSKVNSSFKAVSP